MSVAANDPVDITELPRLGTVDFTSLDPAYKRMRSMFTGAIGGLLVVVGIIVTIATESWIAAVVTAAVAAIVGAVIWLQRIEADRMGYLVRELDLSVRSGILWRSEATVPFARVQHVSISRNPFERRFGIASLELSTAGGNVWVPGLTVERAEQLKKLVADRAGELAELESDDDGTH